LRNAFEMASLPTATGRGAAVPWEDLRAIASAGQIRSASPGDRVAGVQPEAVFEPDSEKELAAALHCADAAGLSVVPRGGGTKTSWGNPPIRADLILSMARLNRVIEHAWADLTVSVEAGCTFQQLQNALAQHGQRIAVDPLWPERATIGGILSTNDSGTLRIRYGGLRDLIIGMTIALPDGTLASSGGKVVKNVAGYDLPKLATGALGTLGVITRAVFRLHPLPHNLRSFTFETRDLTDATASCWRCRTPSWRTPGCRHDTLKRGRLRWTFVLRAPMRELRPRQRRCGNWRLRQLKSRPAMLSGRRGKNYGLRRRRQRSQKSAFFQRRSQRRVAAFATWPIL